MFDIILHNRFWSARETGILIPPATSVFRLKECGTPALLPYSQGPLSGPLLRALTAVPLRNVKRHFQARVYGRNLGETKSVLQAANNRSDTDTGLHKRRA